MKVLALNSSPRSSSESYTVKMLVPMVEGMCDAGAEVEVVNLREKKIKNCIGCFTCWTKTPGTCVQKDDMTNELYPKWLASDMAVYASPLYYHTLNAAMAAFIERTLPVSQPFFEHDEDGKTYHPLRHSVPAGVILSVCGFPDESEFEPMVDFFTQTSSHESPALAFICRAGASLLSSPFLKNKVDDVLDAVKQAGRELVTGMKVTPETMARITQPLGDTSTFKQMGNMYWKTCIAEGITPKQFDDKKMVPRPYSLEDFMFMMTYALNADAAGDKKAIVQFTFSGEVADSCYFSIEKGRVNATQGISDQADLTIKTPFSLWADIMTGKADGAQMFAEQKYTVQGDMSLMMQLLQRG